MFYYLTSDEFKDYFDVISERNIVNKEIKRQITFDGLMNFIKKELRNVEVQCLAIDMSILGFEEDQDFNDILDMLYVLNPFSKIILINAAGHINIRTNSNLLILPDNEAAAGVLAHFLSQEAVTEAYEAQEQTTSLDKASEKRETNKKPTKPKVNRSPEPKEGAKQRRIRQLVSEPFQENEIESNNALKPELLFEKAAAPNKVSEGKPLIRRIQQEADQEEGTGRRAKEAVENHSVQEQETSHKEEKWSCSNVVIAMVGTERKVGTTAAAINLASSLAAVGARVSYSEANPHEHLESLAKEYGFVYEEGHYRWNSLALFKNSEFDTEAGMNFIILDLGSFAEGEQIQQRQLKIIKEVADHVIIISGKQPYEQKALMYALYLLSEKESNILFANVSEDEIQRMKGKYSRLAKVVSYISYEPIMTEPTAWPEELIQLIASDIK